MPNDFYTRAYSPLPEQRVSSQVLKDEFARVEAGFDEVQSDADRAIKLPVGTADQTLAMDAVARANLVLAFNASGNITAISHGRYRGDWLTATAYVGSDYFRDPASKNIYSVVAAHTSGVLATDISAGRVQLAINVADVEAAKSAAETAAATATTQAGLASTSASTATTQAGIATTKASEASASAGTASTDASTATTQAGIATTKAGEANASAIAAADSAASIAGGPVASVNGRTGVVTGVQDTLVSGTTIKTIGGASLLGSGDIAVGPSLTRSARTSNTILGTDDKGTLIDITSGTFSQTFDAVATLGDGWWCYLHNSGTGVVTLDPSASETIDGAATLAVQPGWIFLVQCDGTALRTIPIRADQTMIVLDEKASGTVGGAATIGAWTNHVINTVKTNTIAGASLASDQITLPAGRYEISAQVAGFLLGAFKARIRNITDSQTLGVGMSTHATAAAVQVSEARAAFTLSASKTIAIQYFAGTAAHGGDLGQPTSSAEAEVYASVLIRKIWSVV